VSDDDLIAAGFVRVEDGALLVPPTAGMRLIPTGRWPLAARAQPVSGGRPIVQKCCATATV
jgi:hypothetical protein